MAREEGITKVDLIRRALNFYQVKQRAQRENGRGTITIRLNALPLSNKIVSEFRCINTYQPNQCILY